MEITIVKSARRLHKKMNGKTSASVVFVGQQKIRMRN